MGGGGGERALWHWEVHISSIGRGYGEFKVGNREGEDVYNRSFIILIIIKPYLAGTFVK